MLFFIQWSFDRGFVAYINASEQPRIDTLLKNLEAHYASYGSWDNLLNEPRQWMELHRQSGVIGQRPRGPRRPPENRSPRPPRDGAHRPRPPRSHATEPQSLGRRLMLFDAEQNRLIGPRRAAKRAKLTPILHEGSTVGYLGLVPVEGLENMNDISFVTQQTQSFAIIAILVIVVSALASLPLAWLLTAPVQSLAGAVRKLAVGSYDTRIAVAGHDELGQLSHDVNMLAKTLQENEQARRQWIADISHELRTPLAVLQGEIEALQDGIREPTPKNLTSLCSEVHQLNGLVSDLYELSMSDIGALSYKKINVDIIDTLETAIAGFQQGYLEKGINIEFSKPSTKIELLADTQRLQQLFGNLLKNTLRYTDAGGKLIVKLEIETETLYIDFQDSAPGVDCESLPLLFERLYRVESSRNRAVGGAGLGLAICRNIVNAHEGAISAMASPLGGLWIRVELPLSY
ncbi:MAG: ATP-binding protein [Pseudomonadota bacterium]